MSETLIGVIIGSLATGIPGVLVPWFTARQQARQHRRDLASQVALELWRRRCTITDTANTKREAHAEAETSNGRPTAANPHPDPDFAKILDDVSKKLDSLT